MLIILDRDGVINEDSPNYIKTPDEWIPIPGSLAAIAKLNKAGHTVVVATNQSGVARGYYDLATLEKIHAKMRAALADVGGHVDGIFFCPHGPEDGCECRKPKPGLFWQIAKTFNTDFNNALTIGDSLRDIEAAQAVQCKSVLVKTGNGQSVYEKLRDKNILIFDDLVAVVNEFLQVK